MLFISGLKTIGFHFSTKCNFGRSSKWPEQSEIQKWYSYQQDTNNRLTRYVGYELDCDYDCGYLSHVLSYDDNGNMIKHYYGGTAWPVYEYDAKNRLRYVSAPASGGYNQMYFSYDPYDYRIAKYKNGTARHKLYHLEGEHIEAVYEADYNGGSYGNESPVATFLRGVVVDEIVNGYYYDAQGEKTNYTFHHDQLQSVTGLSVQDGEVLERNSYEGFGGFSTEWNGGWFTNSTNIQKFTGREYDEETRLYYYRARYYDPYLGRFMSEDPKGFVAGVNFYAYVQNNPINFNDPMGLVRWGDAGKATMGLIGNGLGVAVGSALLGAPEPTPATKVVGGVVLGKSVGGWGLSWYNLTQAFNEETMTFDAPSSATRAIAALSAPGNKDAMLLADAADLTIDLLAGNARVYAYGTPTIEGVNGVTRAYDPVETIFTQPGVVQRFQESQTIQTIWDDASAISERLFSSNASGGFVLYPNKPNTNMMQQVYSK